MERYQLEMLASLYGLAMTIAGQNAHCPAYDGLLTPGERGVASALLDEVTQWLDRGFWPGEAAVESAHQTLLRLHQGLFERWRFQLEDRGNGREPKHR